MNRTVRILACVSMLLVTAAIVLGRIGLKASPGLVPVADPSDLMFGNDGGSDSLWTEVAMLLLLAGLSTALATVRCWLQNRGERVGFSRQITEVIPKG
jgi:hypothetical protein